MKVIIAGSRSISDRFAIQRAITDAGFHITEVVSGCARGVDREGEIIATTLHVPVRRFPADWSTLGRLAGFLRNIQMAEYADALIAVWDGTSPGTKQMISQMTLRGKKVHVHHYEKAPVPHALPRP